MIEIDAGEFGIRTHIEEVFTKPHVMAMGSHRFRVGSNWYGCAEPDATLLGCSRDAIVERLQQRGRRVSDGLGDQDPAMVMQAWLVSEYGRDIVPWAPINGMDRERLNKAIHFNYVRMAPDGDAAFDDGSQILQFDVGETVLIVACRIGGEAGWPVAKDLSVARLPAGAFYSALEEWLRAFDAAVV